MTKKKLDLKEWFYKEVVKPVRKRKTKIVLPFLEEDKTFTIPWLNKEVTIKKEYQDITAFGKTLHIENEIPGLIQDVFDNIACFKTRDGLKPVVAHSKRSESGWHLVINMPPGTNFSQIKDRREYFMMAAKAYVDIQLGKDYLVHMDIKTTELPDKVLFSFDPRPYMKTMALPWPIGVTHGGKLIVVDLAKFPHLLAGGATNFGKSSFILVLAYAMLFLQKYDPDRVKLAIIDRKGLDFYQLSDHALVLEDEPDILTFMSRLTKEHERRKKILRKYGCKKIQQYKGQEGPLPYIVSIFDEFAELEDKNIHYYVNKAVRLFRSTGIHLVAATQRPSVVGGVMDGDTRSQFLARCCFKVASETDSRMILGEQHNEAAWLPGDIPGRAYFCFGIDTQLIQSMFIDEALEPKLLAELGDIGGGWNYEFNAKRLLPR